MNVAQSAHPQHSVVHPLIFPVGDRDDFFHVRIVIQYHGGGHGSTPACDVVAFKRKRNDGLEAATVVSRAANSTKSSLTGNSAARFPMIGVLGQNMP